mmetsp:Transcript_9958/g.15912  ORF Transcript_9958/g.15912 Transcript_9958/m.15912 type:complete len:271 (-) Transcript_9958:412-1224(-)
MGAKQSSPADVLKVAAEPTSYTPSLPVNPENTLVYFDLQLGRYGDATPLGRVTMELKEDATPKTAENFKQLCLAEEGNGYKGSRFHRVIPQFMCQGGDFTNDNGTGGRSIYGRTFADENFTLPHAGSGILSMANAGPNTNGSQFFLCTASTPFLNGKHTVFGQVVDGYNVIKAVEACGSRSGDTSADVIIGDCGVVAASSTSASAGGRRVAAGAGSSTRGYHTAAAAAAGARFSARAAVSRGVLRAAPRVTRAVPRVGRALSVMSMALVA